MGAVTLERPIANPFALFRQQLTTTMKGNNMNRIKTAGLIVCLIILQGCSTYSTNRYSINAGNVVALKAYQDTKITVGHFTATNPGVKSVTCRAVGPIPTPDGETYENYIRNALISELQIADAYSPEGSVTLTGNLNEITPNSVSGNWRLSLTINSSNGRAITVDEIYEFKTSYYGETACNQTAQALMPAVQNLISKLVLNPEFPNLVR